MIARSKAPTSTLPAHTRSSHARLRELLASPVRIGNARHFDDEICRRREICVYPRCDSKHPVRQPRFRSAPGRGLTLERHDPEARMGSLMATPDDDLMASARSLPSGLRDPGSARGVDPANLPCLAGRESRVVHVGAFPGAPANGTSPSAIRTPGLSPRRLAAPSFLEPREARLARRLPWLEEAPPCRFCLRDHPRAPPCITTSTSSGPRCPRPGASVSLE